MKLFKKKKFLQKIKQKLPEFESVKLTECEYKSYPFSEWLTFNKDNILYTFYHAKIWGEERITYRKQHFNAALGKAAGPIEIKTLSYETSEQPAGNLASG